MSLFGPRLDRPSAVGDEGRPRATSLTIASVVILGLAAVTFTLLDNLAVATTLAFAVGIFVAGMALLMRQRVRNQVVGHFLFHAGGVLLLVALIEGTIRVESGLLAFGFGLALFGLTATWANVLTEDRLDEVTRSAPISYIALLVSLVVLTVVLGIVAFGIGSLMSLGDSTDPATSLFGFLVWATIASFVVSGTIWIAPYHELLPRQTRSERKRRIEAISKKTAVFGVVSLATLAVTSDIGLDSINAFAASNQTVGSLLVGLSSPLVVGPLALISTVGLLLTLVTYSITRAASMAAAGNSKRLAGTIAGGLVALFVIFLVPVLSVGTGGLFALGIGTLVLIAFFASVVLLVGTFLTARTIQSGVLPDRAAGPATCAAGLVLAAIGAGLAELAAPLVFACVAGAILVWDVSTFGLGVTVELGHRPDTRRLELYHGLLSTGVGVGAVAAVSGLFWVREIIETDGGAWSAVALAVLGALLLAFAAFRNEA